MILITDAPETAQGTALPMPNLLQDNTLTLAGYASRFDLVDLSGDHVRRGAFSAALLSRTEKLPMLFNHETEQPIGVWDEVFEDDIGLYVRGRLFLGNPETDRIARLITSGSVSGLSIGFRTRRFGQRLDGGRDLLDIELWEVSIVAFPMLPSARLTEIGSDNTGSTFLDDVVPLPQANEMTKESVNA